MLQCVKNLEYVWQTLFKIWDCDAPFTGTMMLLIQIMACHLFDTKPLSEPVLTWTLGNKFQWKCQRYGNLVIDENAFEHVVCKIYREVERLWQPNSETSFRIISKSGISNKMLNNVVCAVSIDCLGAALFIEAFIGSVLRLFCFSFPNLLNLIFDIFVSDVDESWIHERSKR